MDEKAIEELYIRCDTPAPVIKHMAAVAAYQDQLLDKLEKAGLIYDRKLMRSAALLHDICRAQKDHAKAGATLLESEGYSQIAAIVKDHHSPAVSEEIDLTPQDILYYADKRLQGDSVVTIQERFAASKSKCTSPEAIRKHEALLKRALMIETEIAKRTEGNNGESPMKNSLVISKVAPSADEWLREAKAGPAAENIGMYLTHTGVVRKTAKAKVRMNAEGTRAVSGMKFSYEKNKVEAAIASTYELPGIYYLRVWLNEGQLELGDTIMQVLVGGDIRPHVVDGLQHLVEIIKSECVIEEEIYE